MEDTSARIAPSTYYAANVRPSPRSIRDADLTFHPVVEQVYRRMIGLRWRPWLVDGVLKIELVETLVWSCGSRARHGQESLALTLNLGSMSLLLSDAAEVLEAQPAVAAGDVPPHGWAVVAG